MKDHVVSPIPTGALKTALPISLTDIEAAAKAATPGPWTTPDHALSVHKKEAPCIAVAFMMTKSGACENHEANSRYVASCSPDVVLSMVAAIRAAQTYYQRYAQDEADDGEYADAGKEGPHTGCSNQQARDALALREALQPFAAAEKLTAPTN